MDAVRIENVTKTFGTQVAVDDLSLVVPQGSIYGFIGPNGSGKTTTLRMIMRIYPPDTGTIHVLGVDTITAANDEVGYLPEERGLYKEMYVRDLIRFYAQLKNKTVSTQEIDQWLERIELPDVTKKKVRDLSKGMSQKVQFIATVISRPKLLLLDEPFSGLDPVNAVVIRDLILELKRQGTTIIFSTHDMSVAEQMCDKIFMIYRGKKVLDDTLDNIRKSYGRDIIRLKMLADSQDIERVSGVASVADWNQYKELRLDASADPQQVLQQLQRIGAIEHFELASPSLQDIFVRIASPEHESSVSTMA